MSKFKIDLGVTAKSNITGFKGVVTSRSEHINGCDRYFINPPVDSEGKLPDGYWFDESELIVIGSKKVRGDNNKDRGGFHSMEK